MVRANHTMLIEDNSLQSKTQPSVKPSIQSAMEAVLFWVHQVLFGWPSAVIGLDLLGFVTTDRTPLGLVPVMGLFLAWIGGTLLWGLASLLHHPLLSLKTSEQGAIREKTSSWVTS